MMGVAAAMVFTPGKKAARGDPNAHSVLCVARVGVVSQAKQKYTGTRQSWLGPATLRWRLTSFDKSQTWGLPAGKIMIARTQSVPVGSELNGS
jgi:hypothetical protein